MDGQLTGRVLKFGEIDTHASVFQSDSFPTDVFPLDVQLNLLHSESKRDVIGRATITMADDGLDYTAEFFSDARSQEARQNIIDYPDTLQVSLEAEPIEAEQNADGVTFYKVANITGLAVVERGSAPSSSVETKRGFDPMAGITVQNEELEKLNLEIKREELAQAKAKTIKLEAENELADAKKAELERTRLTTAKAGTNWLDTEEATIAFGRAIIDASDTHSFADGWKSTLKANDNSEEIERSADAFTSKWKKTLVTRGITGFQAPTGFLEMITLAVEQKSEFWKYLNHTGLTTLQVAKTAPIYGNGYAHDEKTAKKETDIALEYRQLTPQDVYVYTTIARSTLLLGNDTNAVINFVMNQLPKAVVETVERAIILGQADITSIYPIATDKWASTSTPVNAREAVIDIAENIEIANNIVVVMSKAQYRSLKWEMINGQDNQLVIPFGATKEEIAKVMGVDHIVTPSYMKGKDQIIGFSAGEYLLVGNTTAESFQDFDLPFNRERILMEIWAGGSINGEGRAHVATVTPATGGDTK